MKQEALSILEIAASKINLDAREMQDLRNAVQEGDEQSKMKTISDFKQKVYRMLEGEGYPEFCANLLRGQGML